MQQRGCGCFGYANDGPSPISVEILLIAYLAELAQPSLPDLDAESYLHAGSTRPTR